MNWFKKLWARFSLWEYVVVSDDELVFGPHIADLLKRLSKGDLSAADLLWHIGGRLDRSRQHTLENRIHAELKLLGLEDDSNSQSYRQ